MKSTKLTITLAATVFTLTLSGCSKNEASFSQVEANRAVANDNSRFNAQKWRAENGFAELDILGRGDSTQQANCPQGDGWASVDLINKATKQPEVKLKCSTVSANIGCVQEKDFKARAVLSSQENKCNGDIPNPIKKITE